MFLPTQQRICTARFSSTDANELAAHFDVLDHVCKVQSCSCRLVKAGLLDKKYAKRFSVISAWAELVGYVGNVTLNSLRIAASVDRELMLTKELVRRKKVRAT